MLKKIFLVAILSCAISYVYAQGEAKLQDYYCVVFGSTPLKSQTNLKIIWGDDNSAKTLLDETGQERKFNSMPDWLNFMSSLGWDMIQYIELYSTEKAQVLKKKASSLQDAKKGLYFKEDFPK